MIDPPIAIRRSTARITLHRRASEQLSLRLIGALEFVEGRLQLGFGPCEPVERFARCAIEVLSQLPEERFRAFRLPSLEACQRLVDLDCLASRLLVRCLVRIATLTLGVDVSCRIGARRDEGLFE